MNKFLKILFILIFCLNFSSCEEKNTSNQYSNTDDANLEGGYERAKLIKVIDGDTIRVKVDGESKKVRFIGINTPELAKDGKKAQFMAEEAKDFTEKILKDKTIYLEKDVDDTDKYDRLLRYIWLDTPVKNPSLEDIRDKTLNGLLVKEGYAYSNYYKPNIKYQDLLEKLEDDAKTDKLGIHKKHHKKK